MKKIALLIHMLLIPAICLTGCYSGWEIEVPSDWGFGGAGGNTDNSAPSATTAGALSRMETYATVGGSVNPNGTSSYAWFEWSANPGLLNPNTTPSRPLGGGHAFIDCRDNLTGLARETTYYFRIVGQNFWGTRRGEISSFVTRGPNLIVNGSFEDPDIPVNSAITVSGPISGWTPDPRGAYQYQIQDRLDGWAAFDGGQYAVLGGTSFGSWIGQSIPTVTNRRYTLMFAFSPRPGHDNSINTIGVQIEDWVGPLAGYAVNADGHMKGATWRAQSYSFTARAASSTISFIAFADPGDNSGGCIDDVRVYLEP